MDKQENLVEAFLRWIFSAGSDEVLYTAEQAVYNLTEEQEEED